MPDTPPHTPTRLSQLFLLLVGLAYLLLGIWCSLLPETTSASVGFDLHPGKGDSEFLTVYGGLEVGLGLVFLWPVVKRSDITFALHSCLVIHSGLVLFRSISFFCYTGFETATYVLAAIEWTILVFSAVLFIRHRIKEQPGVTENTAA